MSEAWEDKEGIEAHIRKLERNARIETAAENKASEEKMLAALKKQAREIEYPARVLADALTIAKIHAAVEVMKTANIYDLTEPDSMILATLKEACQFLRVQFGLARTIEARPDAYVVTDLKDLEVIKTKLSDLLQPTKATGPEDGQQQGDRDVG